MSDTLEERLRAKAVEQHDETIRVYASDVVELLDARDNIIRATLPELAYWRSYAQAVIEQGGHIPVWNELPQESRDWYIEKYSRATLKTEATE